MNSNKEFKVNFLSLENKKKYNPNNKYESSFDLKKMHHYKNLQKNILRTMEGLISSLRKAREEGILIEKSKKYKEILEKVKANKSYERTIKMVTLSMFF
jgi:hypothetical protein